MASHQPDDEVINDLWEKTTESIVAIEPGKTNWKQHVLPLARIKKIMKSDEVIYAEMEREERPDSSIVPANPRFMIAGEAPILLGKACELLVKEMTLRAWRHTERNRRRTLQKQDVHAAVGESEVYDFLIDIVPRGPMQQQQQQQQQVMHHVPSQAMAQTMPTQHQPMMSTHSQAMPTQTTSATINPTTMNINNVAQSINQTINRNMNQNLNQNPIIVDQAAPNPGLTAEQQKHLQELHYNAMMQQQQHQQRAQVQPQVQVSATTMTNSSPTPNQQLQAQPQIQTQGMIQTLQHPHLQVPSQQQQQHHHQQQQQQMMPMYMPVQWQQPNSVHHAAPQAQMSGQDQAQQVQAVQQHIIQGNMQGNIEQSAAIQQQLQQQIHQQHQQISTSLQPIPAATLEQSYMAAAQSQERHGDTNVPR